MTLSPCNHTFCSICVRQSFTLHQTESIYKHCPTCRQQLTSVEKDLRNNRLIDELLKHYRLIRTKTIVALRDDVLIRRSGDIDRFAEVGTQTAAALDSNNDANESGGCLSGAYRNKSRPDREGFAQCPVCNRQVPIEQAEFNRHLDDCLTRQSQFVQQDDDNNNNNNSSKPPARLQMERTCRQRTAIKKHHDISSSDFDCDNRTNDNDEEDGEGDFTETSPFVTRTRLTNNLIGQQPKEQSGTARKPLKKPWFSGLSDSKLRQLLSGYGIPTYGSRKVCRERKCAIACINRLS
jgi:hypothetical protein